MCTQVRAFVAHCSNDITLNNDHEVNDFLQRIAATENVPPSTATKNKLSSPVVNKFVFTDTQPTEIENDETILCIRTVKHIEMMRT